MAGKLGVRSSTNVFRTSVHYLADSANRPGVLSDPVVVGLPVAPALRLRGNMHDLINSGVSNAAWLTVGALVTALELFAVFDKKSGDTISSHFWQIGGINGYKVKHSSLRRILLVAAWSILTVHLFTAWI